MAVAMAVAQLVLPGVAADSVHNRLARSGTGVSVSVRAAPAIELLWHDADEVDVRMTSYTASESTFAGMLHDATGVGTLHVSIGTFRSGVVVARDVSVTKHDDRLDATATVTDADLRAASSGILGSVVPVSSSGPGLTLRGSVLSNGSTVSLRVTADGGRIVAQAAGGTGVLGVIGSFLGSLAGPITVFDDPQVHVDSLGATPVAGGVRLSATATLR